MGQGRNGWGSRNRPGTPKDFGGSYKAETTENAEPEPNEPQNFVMKEKIGEMLKYGMPLADKFSRRDRRLADVLRETMLEMYRLVIRLEKKYHKKTTLEDLDIELAILKEFVILASDKDYRGPKYAPALDMHQRETWSRYNTEIGNIIGGYKKFLAQKSSDGGRK